MNDSNVSHYCNGLDLPKPPQLKVIKTPDNGTFLQGAQVSYQIVVSNPAAAGAQSATNVTLTDALPGNGGLVWQTAMTSQGTCTLSENNLSCALGTIAPQASVTVTVTSPATTPAAACQSQPNPVAKATADDGLTAQDSGSLSCTPTPNITIVKYTNGVDPTDPNASNVPNIAPGALVTWQYQVTNTGSTSVPRANVVVTDSTTGVSPTFAFEAVGNRDTIFDPGEVWFYQAQGTTLDLTLPPPAGVTTVANACTHGGTQPPRTAYTNRGTVTIPGASAFDDSSYCNPLPVCDLSSGALSFNKQNATFTVTNSGAKDSILSQIVLNWPTVNGKLKKILIGSNVVYDTRICPRLLQRSQRPNWLPIRRSARSIETHRP